MYVFVVRVYITYVHVPCVGRRREAISKKLAVPTARQGKLQEGQPSDTSMHRPEELLISCCGTDTYWTFMEAHAVACCFLTRAQIRHRNGIGLASGFVGLIGDPQAPIRACWAYLWGY